MDFDDLIRLALLALQRDEKLLLRLRQRWPFILEDEAQDSSRLQEQILRLLAGPDGNWVRVGDPNQAIYETFTTASPQFLRRFLEEPGVQRRELPNSGRSTASIIDLANSLVTWTETQHPAKQARGALSPPLIEPTPPDDPQPNPPDDPEMIFLMGKGYSPAAELNAVIEFAGALAAGAPRRDGGGTDAAQSSAASTWLMRPAGVGWRWWTVCCAALIDPGSRRRAGQHPAASGRSDPITTPGDAFRVWQRNEREDDEVLETGTAVQQAAQRLSPGGGLRLAARWARLAGGCVTCDEDDLALLLTFRALVQRWQAAAVLPIDQLLLTLAQDLFTEPSDLAVAHKLAVTLRQQANSIAPGVCPSWPANWRSSPATNAVFWASARRTPASTRASITARWWWPRCTRPRDWSGIGSI